MPRITELKKLIVERGRVQSDIAQAAGISDTRLSRIVNGRVKPTEAERLHIAHALGMKREELPKI